MTEEEQLLMTEIEYYKFTINYEVEQGNNNSVGFLKYFLRKDEKKLERLRRKDN
jgi:hypothetical protein